MESFTQTGAQLMTDEEFGLLADYAHDRFGLYFESDKRNLLEFKLRPRLKLGGFTSYKDYYHHLMFHPSRGEEEIKLIAALTNHESYFYREMNQLNTFIEEVIDEVLASRASKRKLRILSAGCSTGEEPYTLAMLLSDSNRTVSIPNIEVVGIDLDPAAVKYAKTAVYGKNSMRAAAPDKLEKHFSLNDDHYILNDKIRRMVRFDVGNIVSESLLASEQKFDFIFCRNVLIYFSHDSIRRATDNFARLLSDDGRLFLGHSESIMSVSTRYVPVRKPKAIYYRKA